MRNGWVLIAALIMSAGVASSAEPGDDAPAETAEPTESDTTESVADSTSPGPGDGETRVDDNPAGAEQRPASDTDDAGGFDEDIEVRGPGQAFEPTEAISADSAVSFPADI